MFEKKLQCVFKSNDGELVYHSKKSKQNLVQNKIISLKISDNLLEKISNEEKPFEFQKPVFKKLDLPFEPLMPQTKNQFKYKKEKFMPIIHFKG